MFGAELKKSCIILIACAALAVFATAADGQKSTVKVELNGRSYVGKQLAYDGRDMVLMRRDGRISILNVKNSSAISRVSGAFEPYQSEFIRQKLQKEFGVKYQVSKTRNFVVVHPPGDFQNWAMPFEILYQRFRNYFSSRGFSVDNPQFPMVAVVLRKRSEFDKFLRTYHTYNKNTLGYYSQKSNRIITYDPSNGRSTKKDWAFNDTLIHEAVHQTAFNVGVHKRYGFTPHWVLEGLACMFEAKGIHNSMYYSAEKDRINKTRLIRLKYYYSKNRVQGKLAKFIADDDTFDSDPSVAYAYSWGLTFFLAEKFPAEFFTFLRNDANRKEFQEFTAEARLSAFMDVFGDDINGLDKRLERFIAKLKN